MLWKILVTEDNCIKSPIMVFFFFVFHFVNLQKFDRKSNQKLKLDGVYRPILNPTFFARNSAQRSFGRSRRLVTELFLFDGNRVEAVLVKAEDFY